MGNLRPCTAWGVNVKMRNGRSRGTLKNDSNMWWSQAQEELPELPCRRLGYSRVNSPLEESLSKAY